MFRTRLPLCALLALAASAGCRAQNALPTPFQNPAAGMKLDEAKMDRRIELLVRSQMQIPSEYDVKVGVKARSTFPGYSTLPITFSIPSKPDAKPATIDFLLSDDGTTLVRLQKFDLTKDPANVAQLANRPVRGDQAAKVTIVNFDDLECPYCARMHQELFPQTLDRYKGLIKVVYKDDPLVEIHPWAMHASVDANCLADQSGAAYWAFVDYVHSHGDEISGPDRDPAKAGATLDRLAREQGAANKPDKLDPVQLEACLKKQDNGAVLASMQEADHLKIDGTPTLFVNGERIAGVVPIQEVWSVIDRALAAEGEKPPTAAPTASPTPAPAPSANPAPKTPAGN